jgi:hypothetical protein
MAALHLQPNVDNRRLDPLFLEVVAARLLTF